MMLMLLLMRVEASPPEREAEEGSRKGMPQVTAKVEVGREGIWELVHQGCVGVDVDLQPRVGRRDVGQVARMGVKDDNMVPADKAGDVGQMIDGVEAQTESTCQRSS